MSKEIEISVDSQFEPYCSGCRNVIVETEASNLYGDFELKMICVTVTCSHSELCKRLAERMKEVSE